MTWLLGGVAVIHIRITRYALTASEPLWPWRWLYFWHILVEQNSCIVTQTEGDNWE